MKKIYPFAACALLLSVVTSCGEKLTDGQLEVINEFIPLELYEESVNENAKNTFDYFYECLDVYSDKVKNGVEKDIEGKRQTDALFGGSFFDLNTLVGSSAEEQWAKRYNSYIKFINGRFDNIEKLIEDISEAVIDDPSILDDYYESLPATVTFRDFRDIHNMPRSVSREEWNKLDKMDFDNNLRSKWGEMICPYSKKGNFEINYSVIAVATVQSFMDEDYPEAVYAVYDSENKTWKVGYDTEVAVEIKFKGNSDVTEYDWEYIDYYPAYIESSDNQIKSKK